MATRKYQRLSPSQWAEARTLWQIGDVTLAELSDRFGVAHRTLLAHFAKHGIEKGSKTAALVAAVESEILGKALSEPADLAERIKATREAAYTNAVAIEKLMMAQLQNATSEPSEAYKAQGALKALSLASGTLERLYGVKSAALGIDKDTVLADELPVLILRDLSKEDIEGLRSDGEDEEDLK